MFTYSKSFFSFLQKSNGRIAKVLRNLHNRQYPAHQLMFTTNMINYLHFRSDGTISYLPAGRPHCSTPTGRWSSKGRVSGKPGKVIKKLFTPKALQFFNDADFEYFCNLCKSNFCNSLKFYLQPNHFIPDMYNRRRAEGSGTLNSSCMNNKGHYMEMYTNCSQLRILVLVNKHGELCGRALVWKIGHETIMDRIYVAQDFMYECFINYAVRRKWLYKVEYKTYSDKTLFVLPSGDTAPRYFKIKTKTDFDYYPYIDTFSYGDNGSINNFGEGDYTYDCACGERKYIPDGDDDDNDGDYNDEDD